MAADARLQRWLNGEAVEQIPGNLATVVQSLARAWREHAAHRTFGEAQRLFGELEAAWQAAHPA